MAEPGELSFEQQEELNKIKVDQRREDAMYLREHPELTLMVNSFLRTVLEEAPDDPLTFAQDFFTQRRLAKHILRIEDAGDSSSSGDEIELGGDEQDKELRRIRVQSMMKEKRRLVAQRRRRAAQAKPVMDLNCDSETDEEDESAKELDANFGLSEERVAALMKLFVLVDRDGSGSIDSYELSVFATAFFRTLKDVQLREEAEEMMEEIDLDKNGRIDKEEYLSYFSLVVGLMSDDEFQPIFDDLVESFETAAGGAAEEGSGEESAIPGERLVKLQMLFQGWDPKNSGNVPSDIVAVLARACEPFTQKEANEVMGAVPDVVSRKDFIGACVAAGLHQITDEQFTGIVDPLLEKRMD